MQSKIIQFDVSRGRIPKPETIFRNVDFLKKHGLNGVMFYMEDVVENSIFPTAGCGKTPITKDYLAHVKEYLQKNNLEFIPLLQILGHQCNLLHNNSTAEHRELPNEGGCFRIDSPETTAKVKSWVAEIIPFFNSEFVHVGTDEVFEIGLGRSAGIIKAQGFETAIAGYLNDWCAFLGKLGKKMVMYADFLIHYPAMRDMLSKEIIMCNWGYGTYYNAYEKDNRNFAMHEFVTADRRNWVAGVNGAEYTMIPFRQIEENVRIWLELGGKSCADTFVIGDWGSRENVNPYSLSAVGSMYILKRLRQNDLSIDDFLEDLSCEITGGSSQEFKRSLKIMLLAQNNTDYFSRRLIEWAPFFPTLLYNDPESKSLLRVATCLELDGLMNFENDMRDAVGMLESIPDERSRHPWIIDDLRHLSKRLLALALRSRLCYEFAWNTGAFWLEEKKLTPNRRYLGEYLSLAKSDIEWYMAQWDSDNFKTCRDRCLKMMTDAMESTRKTLIEPRNCMRMWPPEISKIRNPNI